jgi:flagellar secretion chaperone FliS
MCKVMRNHGYQNYLDQEVLSASPLRLIQLLYGGALESIAAARRSLRQRDIRARTRAINKAIGILNELSRALNYEADRQLSRNLAGLYGYIVRLLIEANLKQMEAPLAEAEGLLSTLAEAWKACAPLAPERGFLASDPHLADALSPC